MWRPTGIPTGMGSPFEPSSPFAAAIASLFRVTLGVCAVVFVCVAGAIAYALVAFRARPGAGDPPQVAGHPGLEIAWTVVPLLIVAALFFLSVETMARSDPRADRPP